MATLNTKVILAKNIKMDREYKHVLNYTENQLLNLLRSNSNLVGEISNASFINPTGEILVPFTYSQCLQSNYIAFQNPNYANKWFFGFIDEVRFHSKNMQEIRYTVDSWSTWFSSLTIKPCFVLREHVNDDTIGVNRTPENIDTGEIIDIQRIRTFNTSTFWIAISSTHRPWDNTDFSGITCLNRLINGWEYHLFEINNINKLVNIIGYFYKTLEDKTNLDSISEIFIVPNELIDVSNLTRRDWSVGANSYFCYTLPHDLDEKSYDLTIAKNYTYSGYVPKNNKCKIYPYNYMLVTNNVGDNNIIKYEDFSGNDCIFKIIEAITVGCDVVTLPKNYKNALVNYEEGVSLGKLPTCRLEFRFLYHLA